MQEGEVNVYSPAMTLSPAMDSTNKVPMVKAKATPFITNSLITKQTRESIQRFEQRAGLRGAGRTRHRGTGEETKGLRRAEALRKLKRGLERRQEAGSRGPWPSPPPAAHPTLPPRGGPEAGSHRALPQPYTAQILAPWGLEAGVQTQTWQIDGASLDQDAPTSLTREALPPGLQGSPGPFSHGTDPRADHRMAEGPATFQPPEMDLPVMKGKKPPPGTPGLECAHSHRGPERPPPGLCIRQGLAPLSFLPWL